MSEHGLATPPRERFRINVQAARQLRARDLLVRFVFGAITSAVAAVVMLAFGPRAGGIFLAFPAILAATVTLIEAEESAGEAREDARGAIVGSIALAVFAALPLRPSARSRAVSRWPPRAARGAWSRSVCIWFCGAPAANADAGGEPGASDRA